MTIARWSGEGDGTLVEPYILNVTSAINVEEPFYIRLDSNYTANKNESSYFVFSNDTSTKYLLAIIVQDPSTALYYESKNALYYTTLLTNVVDYTDGPFTLNVYNGVSYILKQQVFSYRDIIDSDIPRFLISALEPASRDDGDFWFDLTLKEGQNDDQFDTPATNFIIQEADLIDADNTPFTLIGETIIINEEYEEFVEDSTESYDEYGNFIVDQF
jgi:hypothetical protein